MFSLAPRSLDEFIFITFSEARTVFCRNSWSETMETRPTQNKKIKCIVLKSIVGVVQLRFGMLN